MILVGDCRESLAGLPDRSVQACVTSPPYFGLRDYGHDGQIGLEPTPDEFVAALVDVFREVRRVLRDDGTVWLNLGDSFCSTDKWGGGKSGNSGKHTTNGEDVPSWAVRARKPTMPGVKPKDLIGIPWMVAFALRTDGWYLRSDIIWAKPNPMPESVTDRPTKSHEYLFLLSKGPRYFYDADAIREADGGWDHPRSVLNGQPSLEPTNGLMAEHKGLRTTEGRNGSGRNKRSVWTVATQPYAGAHFATFPPRLIEPCVLAGTSPKACGDCGAPWQRVTGRTPMVVRPSDRVQTRDQIEARTATSGTMTEPPMSRTVGWEPSCECVPKREGDNGWVAAVAEMDTRPCVVLDPFAGSGTVGVVCGWHGRDFVGCELNPDYAAMAEARIALEGRPGGKPAHHEPVKVIADQLGLL